MSLKKYFQFDFFSSYPYTTFLLGSFATGYILTGLGILAYNRIKNKSQ